MEITAGLNCWKGVTCFDSGWEILVDEPPGDVNVLIFLLLGSCWDAIGLFYDKFDNQGGMLYDEFIFCKAYMF